MIKIAYLDYSDIFSGAEKSLYSLIKYLDKHEIEPILICLYPRKHLEPYQSLNIPIVYLSKKIKWWMGRDYTKYAPRGSDFIKRFIFTCKLIIQLKKAKIDILTINLIRIDSFWYVFLPKLFGVKVVFFARSYPGGIPSRFLIKFCDYIICVSDLVKQNYLKKQKTDHIIKIHNPVEVPNLKLSKTDAKYLIKLKIDRNYMASIGLLQEHKGHDTAIKTFAALVNYYPNFDLIIAGGGCENELQRLTNLVEKFGIANRVVITKEQIPNIELVYLASEIILSLTKNGEAFGRIPFEGAAYKVPVIAPNIGAAPELITNEVNGILVDPLDELEIRFYIEKLIGDITFRKKIVENGYMMVEKNLNPSTYSEKITSVYRLITSSKRNNWH
jgi:glycosyltransferase involved in cell wall biosynthesis